MASVDETSAVPNALHFPESCFSPPKPRFVHKECIYFKIECYWIEIMFNTLTLDTLHYCI